MQYNKLILFDYRKQNRGKVIDNYFNKQLQFRKFKLRQLYKQSIG